MNEQRVTDRSAKLAALVLTPNLLLVKEWLERYFGFRASVDWVEEDWSAGRVDCRTASDEISLVGTTQDSQQDHRAIVVLLVDDIDSLYLSFIADGITCSFSRDIGYRPTIDFDRASPFAMFQIEESDSSSLVKRQSLRD